MMRTLRTTIRIMGLYALPVVFSVAVDAAQWAPMTLDLIDALLVSLAIGGVVSFSRLYVEMIASPDPLDATEYVTLALYDLFAYALLAGLWSIRARSAHAAALYDSDVVLRIIFRTLVVRSLTFFLLAQGFDPDRRVSLARWLRVGGLALLALTALACLDVARNRAADAQHRIERQDDAPSPGESHAP